VSPLVKEHAGDLAGVVAAPAGFVEVDREAVPEGVAGRVEVHVVEELLVQPAVRGQPGPAVLGDPVEMVEAGAGGVRVARARSGRHCAIRSGALLQVEVRIAGNRFRDGPAGVGDPDVGTGELRGGVRPARRAGEQPHRIGRLSVATYRYIRI